MECAKDVSHKSITLGNSTITIREETILVGCQITLPLNDDKCELLHERDGMFIIG